MKRGAAPLCLVAVAAACAPTPASTPAPASTLAPAPASALDALEQRLSSARTFRFHARLATSGRIQSHFEGTVLGGEGGRLRFVFQGAFGGKDVDVLFTSDGTHMRGGPRGHVFDMDTPPALRDGTAVEFVRRGLTHDVARLASGETPDSIDGTARRHLEMVGPQHLAGERSPGMAGGAATEAWTWLLYVDHQKAADETLWLDARTGLPLKRRVVVHFPEGDMEVGEEYDDFVVDGPPETDAFRIEP
ncbi:MAG: hypothetical protein ABSE49_22845 [Polyangiaceae bacterium]